MDRKPITLAVADDHTLFRKGLLEIMKSFEEITILYDAGTGFELLEKIEYAIPDVVLLDLEMPDIDGIATARYIISKFPDVKILLLSMYGEEQLVENLLEEGVHGYLTKAAEPDELRNALQVVYQGQKYVQKLPNQPFAN
ncbi:response regulator [Pontibacter beigongshangensis]|uniref:response regulator n=1 Tax=Pontibacter beigongshangensis TaxID=2574733 RepID=UPI0016507B67|nr:response regulator transcription factor [Pontibacter beigongshangensis]